MRVEPNLLTSAIAGQLGDEYVYACSKGTSAGYIETARRFTMPTNPNTPAQQAVRLAFAQASTFFYNAQTKTLGSTTFDRDEFLETITENTKANTYRGIPTLGDSAGRQLFIAGALKRQHDESNYTELSVLPQNMTTEGQLINLKAELAFMLDYVATLKQQTRIGFTNPIL